MEIIKAILLALSIVLSIAWIRMLSFVLSGEEVQVVEKNLFTIIMILWIAYSFIEYLW